MEVIARNWPLVLGTSQIQAKLVADGKMVAESRQNRWSLIGKIDFPHLLASGALLKTQTVNLGPCTLDAKTTIRDALPTWAVEITIAGLAVQSGDRTFKVRQDGRVSARVVSEDSGLRLEQVAVRTAFLSAEGQGSASAGFTLAGSLDLAETLRLLGDLVDFRGVQFVGKARISAGYRDSLARVELRFPSLQIGQAEHPVMIGQTRFQVLSRGGMEDVQLGLDVASTRSDGFEVGPVMIRGGRKAGVITIDPIRTTLNGGALTLIPQLLDTPEGRVLRLDSGSGLENAEVTEVIASRVLAFVAPVLDGATRVHGRVSANVERADFPLRSDVGQKAVVQGQVVFHDLEFSSGPLAAELLSLVGREATPLRLDQPVVLSIADGKVHQTGLAIPVGNLTRIELEGSVGFDRSLDLLASLPVTQQMFPNGGILGDILPGTRFRVPIGGTLSKPKIDKEAFGDEMAGMGRDLLGRGAAGLINRLMRPRDEPAVPKLSAEERKARRQENRAKRRMDRAG